MQFRKILRNCSRDVTLKSIDEAIIDGVFQPIADRLPGQLEPGFVAACVIFADIPLTIGSTVLQARPAGVSLFMFVPAGINIASAWWFWHWFRGLTRAASGSANPFRHQRSWRLIRLAILLVALAQGFLFCIPNIFDALPEDWLGVVSDILTAFGLYLAACHRSPRWRT